MKPLFDYDEAYKIYNTEPGIERLVQLSILERLDQLNEKFDKLLDILQKDAIETYTISE